MTNISTRAEQASQEEARGLLLELALLVHADKPVFHLGRDAFPDFWPWTNRFRRLLDINTPEAHLAAAMMLVPEGWTLYHLGGPFDGPVAHATIASVEARFSEGTAATPALALIAAIARSVE